MRSCVPAALFQILTKKEKQMRGEDVHAYRKSTGKSLSDLFWRARSNQAGAAESIVKMKQTESSGAAVTSLTSHLFEPQQFRGLQLWWHDPPDPVQDPVARLCDASGLPFSTVVHPHHHVLVSVTCHHRASAQHIWVDNSEPAFPIIPFIQIFRPVTPRLPLRIRPRALTCCRPGGVTLRINKGSDYIPPKHAILVIWKVSWFQNTN